MTNVTELKAVTRQFIGKASKRLAAEGLIPGVVYGPKFESLPVSVDRREFERLLHEATVGSTLIDLTIEGQPKPVDVIIRAIKHDETRGTIQHVDFWAVDMGHSIQTTVPITYVGSSEGERTGGVLMHALRELHVEARPKDLPEHIEADVTALAVGDSITVADLTAPRGVTLLDDPETVVASVMAPHVAEEIPVTVEEMAEVPEVGKESAEGSEE